MNWSLVLLLSLFGLAMAVATVFVIPPDIEPAFWLVIFVISAYAIAQAAPEHYLLHGVVVGLANSFWMTAFHVISFQRYLMGHPQEAAMMTSLPLPDSPRLTMTMVGPVIGVVSGLVIGLLAMVAHKLFARPRDLA